jgi:hypothetical protein
MSFYVYRLIDPRDETAFYIGLTNIIGSNAEGSEPPPTLGEIKAARIEAKRQQLLKKRESQYAKFVSDLPAHMQQVAWEWVSGLKESSQETVLLRTDRLSQRAKPWKEVDLGNTKKRRRRCRRKYRPAKPAVQIGGLPPRL